MITDAKACEFYNYLKRREALRIKKATGAPWPWSDDEILNKYKFTNVKRDHDCTTMVLRRDFYNHPAASDPGLLLFNAGIARYFGTWEFACLLGFQTDFRASYIKAFAQRRLERKERVFTGAYVITNQGIAKPKQEVVVDYFLKPLWEAREVLVAIARIEGCWQPMADAMFRIPGFGGSGFMTKEVLLDTIPGSLWPNGTPTDFNTWCPAGPGAQRGLNRLLGHNDPETMPRISQSDALKHMLYLFDQRAKHWQDQQVKLVLHDIQFGLCEYDKHQRVRLGQGKPRSTYKPPKA